MPARRVVLLLRALCRRSREEAGPSIVYCVEKEGKLLDGDRNKLVRIDESCFHLFVVVGDGWMGLVYIGFMSRVRKKKKRMHSSCRVTSCTA